MKVLHVLYSKIYTGAEKVAAQIIKAFEGRVDMAYCSLECEEVWDILDGMGIRHYGVEELTPATLSRVIREYQPDVIHAHDMRTSFVASLCCGKIPLISHIHNNAYDARGLDYYGYGKYGKYYGYGKRYGYGYGEKHGGEK